MEFRFRGKDAESVQEYCNSRFKTCPPYVSMIEYGYNNKYKKSQIIILIMILSILFAIVIFCLYNGYSLKGLDFKEDSIRELLASIAVHIIVITVLFYGIFKSVYGVIDAYKVFKINGDCIVVRILGKEKVIRKREIRLIERRRYGNDLDHFIITYNKRNKIIIELSMVNIPKTDVLAAINSLGQEIKESYVDI